MRVRFVAENFFCAIFSIALVFATTINGYAAGGQEESSSHGSRTTRENQTQESTGSLRNKQTIRAQDLHPVQDPCLSSLYTDWFDFNRQTRDRNDSLAHDTRIVIDRSMFILLMEDLDSQGFTEEIYRTPVALGRLRSPTPEGRFIINHVYCYSDVLFFRSSQELVPNLYNGFFAPLLECDKKGNCRRFNELGIHGFAPEALTDDSTGPEIFGAVSAGCVRLPDPCSFKHHLLKRVEVGPVKRNERGSYHWLKRPLEVIVVNGYTRTDPAATGFLDAVVSGLEKFGVKLQEMLRSLER